MSQSNQCRYFNDDQFGYKKLTTGQTNNISQKFIIDLGYQYVNLFNKWLQSQSMISIMNKLKNIFSLPKYDGSKSEKFSMNNSQ